MTKSEGGLAFENLTVRYGAQVALNHVSLTCGYGEILGLLGPNGAGKSTLLKSALGLLPFDSGQVLLDGEPLNRQRRRSVAYTPQRMDIDWTFPVCVEEVVLMGRQ